MALPYPSMAGGFTPSGTNIDQFDPVTVHSDSAHNNPHSKLLANDQALLTAIASSIPAGAILSFAQAGAPTGWLICNGGAVSRTTYSALFAAIGITYGAGDGVTTFNVPDLRGVFLRGLDSGRGLDPGRAIGTYQADATQRVQGTHGMDDRAMSVVSGAFYSTGSIGPTGSEGGENGPIIGFDNNRVVRTANEERVKNVAITYCIKY